MKNLIFKILDIQHFAGKKWRDISGILFDKDQRQIAYGLYVIERNKKKESGINTDFDSGYWDKNYELLSWESKKKEFKYDHERSRWWFEAGKNNNLRQSKLYKFKHFFLPYCIIFLSIVTFLFLGFNTAPVLFKSQIESWEKHKVELQIKEKEQENIKAEKIAKEKLEEESTQKIANECKETYLKGGYNYFCGIKTEICFEQGFEQEPVGIREICNKYKGQILKI
jgi:hypothetical protein